MTTKDEALTEQPAQQQKPVAWIEHEWSGTGLRHLNFEKREPSVRDEVVNPMWTPLYTSPPASKPLTDEQAVKVVQFAIHNLSLTCEGPLNVDDIGMWVLRAAEAAHGIKGDA